MVTMPGWCQSAAPNTKYYLHMVKVLRDGMITGGGVQIACGKLHVVNCMIEGGEANGPQEKIGCIGYFLPF